MDFAPNGVDPKETGSRERVAVVTPQVAVDRSLLGPRVAIVMGLDFETRGLLKCDYADALELRLTNAEALTLIDALRKALDLSEWP